VRRLIINADDFGLTSGVNRAIVEAARSGGVTSATIMANGPHFQEAANAAKDLPSLKTGCHVVLIDGQALATGLPSLTDATGRFRDSLKGFLEAAVRKQLSEEEIQREAEAQIRKIQEQGIRLTHVDSHKHTHMFPHVLRPVLRASRACGIGAVRNPFEPARSWPSGVMLRTPGLWVRSVGVLTFGLFARVFHEAIRDEGMLTTDGTIGIAATGKLDQKLLLAILSSLPDGTWELVCHPGYADAELIQSGTRLVRSREVELAALTSKETKRLLEARGIELISYAELKQY
jgi:hopanoid biosynthesis associated protein HpnK